MWIGIPIDRGAWHSHPHLHPSVPSVPSLGRTGGVMAGPDVLELFCLFFFFGIAVDILR